MRREDFETLLERLLVSVVDGGSPPSIKAFQKTAELRDAVLSAWDAQAAELERERMRLSACGVVAVADTPASAARARDMLPEYRSDSCDLVARMVDRLMELRADVEEHRKERAEADKLAACITVGVGRKDAEALWVGVSLTAENAPRARVVETRNGDVLVRRGDGPLWPGGPTDAEIVALGATVLAWRKP